MPPGTSLSSKSPPGNLVFVLLGRSRRLRRSVVSIYWAPCALVGRKNPYDWPADSVWVSYGPRSPVVRREVAEQADRGWGLGFAKPGLVGSEARRAPDAPVRVDDANRRGIRPILALRAGPVAHGFLALGLSSRQAGPSGWPQGGQTVLHLRGGAGEGRDLHPRAPRDGKRLQ